MTCYSIFQDALNCQDFSNVFPVNKRPNDLNGTAVKSAAIGAGNCHRGQMPQCVENVSDGFGRWAIFPTSCLPINGSFGLTRCSFFSFCSPFYRLSFFFPFVCLLCRHTYHPISRCGGSQKSPSRLIATNELGVIFLLHFSSEFVN